MLANNIDEAIALLDTIIAEAKTQRSRRGFFPALYRQVTLKVKINIGNGFFDDDEKMVKFTTKFANRYFAAFDNYSNNRKTTKSWQVAFDALEDPDLLILQHLLLGVNAHINLDLGIVAAEISPGEQLETLHSDFDKINNILADLLDTVQDVLNKLSPLITLLDDVGGRTDEAIINFSIRKARESAWLHAQIMSYQIPALKEKTITLIDSKVAFLGRLVINPGRTLNKAIDLIKKSESEDIIAIIDTLNSIVK